MPDQTPIPDQILHKDRDRFCKKLSLLGKVKDPARTEALGIRGKPTYDFRLPLSRNFVFYVEQGCPLNTPVL